MSQSRVFIDELAGIIGTTVDDPVHHFLNQAFFDLWLFIIHKCNNSTHNDSPMFLTKLALHEVFLVLLRH